MSSITCARCLAGVHRCLTPTCPCTCTSPTRARRTPAPRRPSAPAARRLPSSSRGVRGMALAPAEAAAIPGQVAGIVTMLRRYQLTGSLEAEA